MRMLIIDQKPIQTVANYFGVNRTTIWRWKQKWIKQNEHISLHNTMRHQNAATSIFRFNACKWSIPTRPAIPLHPHCLSEDIVQLVINTKKQLKRCDEVVWHHINCTLCIKVSLSSVRRILARYKLVEHRKKSRRHKGVHRPSVTMTGDLVEIDTVHLYNPLSSKRRYIYTVIDVYSRMAYAKAYDEIRPGLSVKTILEAQRCMGIRFKVVQSDNGSEFSSHFEERLAAHDIAIRHTRLGRPNDNAHIERFNRTLQEECTGKYFIRSVGLPTLNQRIDEYLDYYNYKRIHLGIRYRTPAEMLQRL